MMTCKRARESRTSAEVEVLSSTSNEVCELWSGNEVVRLAGQPPIKEVIRCLDVARLPFGAFECLRVQEWMDLATAHDLGKYDVGPPGQLVTRGSPTLAQSEGDAVVPVPTEHPPWKTDFDQCAPNLTLNIGRAVISKKERWIWSVVATFLQLGVWTVWAITACFLKIGRAHQAPPAYGFPCAISGSIVLFVSVFICGHITEDLTDELDGEPTANKENYRVMRIQRSSTTGSQRFGAYLIHNNDGDTTISMSRRSNVKRSLPQPLAVNSVDNSARERNTSKEVSDERIMWYNKNRIFTLAAAYESLTVIGTTFGCLAFVLQFIGLRTLHWAASISQLGATLIMMVIRAQLRRSLLREPRCDPLVPGHEMSDSAFVLSRDKGSDYRELESLSGQNPVRRNSRADEEESLDIPDTARARVNISVANPTDSQHSNGAPRNGGLEDESSDQLLGWGLLTSIKLDKLDHSSGIYQAGRDWRNLRLIGRNFQEEEAFERYVETLLRTRVALGRLTKWEEECSSWGEPLATTIDNVSRHLESMARSPNQLLRFRGAFTATSQPFWALATYVAHWHAGATAVQEIVFRIDPSKFDLDLPPEREEQEKIGDRMRPHAEYYATILCLWHCRIVKMRQMVRFATTFPFARVVGARSGLVGTNSIRRWLRTELWTVPPDHYRYPNDRWPSWKRKAFDPTLSFGRQFGPSDQPEKQDSDRYARGDLSIASHC